MSQSDYNASLQLTENIQLIVNQRIGNLKRPSGEIVDFVVKSGDAVIFQRTHAYDEENCIHSFVVILTEDVHNMKYNRPCYGEFVLNNEQVEIT